ncbi:MAG: hypothetical protein MUO61_00780 [Dehalococcoidia bacterium]|nr:hypothetical protein [Dehalococcoidia bacterium]
MEIKYSKGIPIQSGKGKIDIAIQKFNYAPGDTISGNVALTLKRPVKARELSVSLIGGQQITQEQATESRSIIFGDHKSQGTSTNTKSVYEFKQQLDGEKQYSQGQEYYFFEIKIPADILDKGAEMTGTIQFFPVMWYLLSKLDIPGRLDISNKVQVTIG